MSTVDGEAGRMRRRGWAVAVGAGAAVAAVVVAIVLVLPGGGGGSTPGGLVATGGPVGPLGAPVASASAAPLPVDSADEAQAAQNSAAFALDLAHALAAQNGNGDSNEVVAPSTVSSVLSMLLPGARGQTASEMEKVLHTTLDPSALAAATGALDQQEQGEAAADGVQLSVSNAVWTQVGDQLQAAYLRILSGAFRSGVHQTDFQQDAEQARQQINALVAQQTHGLIPQVLPPGSLDEFTRMVVTDAVYLKAKWADPFDASATSPEPFHLAGGGSVDVPTMQRSDDSEGISYASADGWQAVELPYQGGHLAMDLLEPTQGAPGPVLPSLDATRMQALLGSLSATPMDLSVPKFTFDSQADLGSTLKQLGMPTVFGPSADFSGLLATATPQLSLGGVYEDAHIAVDENGTTAAGAAAGGVVGAAAPVSNPLTVTFDRPFAFVIRDVSSGRILFLGQVVNPAQAA